VPIIKPVQKHKYDPKISKNTQKRYIKQAKQKYSSSTKTAMMMVMMVVVMMMMMMIIIIIIIIKQARHCNTRL
jgi:uncharacterized membrane protein